MKRLFYFAPLVLALSSGCSLDDVELMSPSDPKDLARISELEDELAKTKEQRDQLDERVNALTLETDDLKRSLSEMSGKLADLEGRLAMTNAALVAAEEERNLANRKVVQLEGRLSKLETPQQVVTAPYSRPCHSVVIPQPSRTGYCRKRVIWCN